MEHNFAKSPACFPHSRASRGSQGTAKQRAACGHKLPSEKRDTVPQVVDTTKPFPLPRSRRFRNMHMMEITCTYACFQRCPSTPRRTSASKVQRAIWKHQESNKNAPTDNVTISLFGNKNAPTDNLTISSFGNKNAPTENVTICSFRIQTAIWTHRQTM